MACDAEGTCRLPGTPERWLEGEPLEERAHVFGGRDYFVMFHPQCCPRQVLGDICNRYHPEACS